MSGRTFIYGAATLAFPAQEPPVDPRAQLQELLPRPPRRVSRFIELALAGAHRGVRSAGLTLPGHCGVYLASERGYVEDTVELQAGMFLRGESPMPVKFINVSGSTSGFYLAQTLGLAGENLTVSSGVHSFEAALELAMLGVAARADGCALVGGVDECAYPLAEHRERLGVPDGTVMGEGSNWLVVGREGLGTPVAEVELVRGFGSLAAVEAAVRELAPCGAIAGTGLDEEALERIAGSARIAQRFEYGHELGYCETASSYGIARFLEAGQGGSLLHANQDSRGRCYVVVVRRV